MIQVSVLENGTFCGYVSCFFIFAQKRFCRIFFTDPCTSLSTTGNCSNELRTISKSYRKTKSPTAIRSKKVG